MGLTLGEEVWRKRKSRPSEPTHLRDMCLMVLSSASGTHSAISGASGWRRQMHRQNYRAFIRAQEGEVTTFGFLHPPGPSVQVEEVLAKAWTTGCLG